ncbi:hypothetical protein [Myroides odoratimimus]|uniref:hypothetical protein n=1 Tax=Myroides odoratimimus TaxID=76832 RepID=UPI0002DC06B8|nr:hypothetical protein [Myroides odoratimimus]
MFSDTNFYNPSLFYKSQDDFIITVEDKDKINSIFYRETIEDRELIFVINPIRNLWKIEEIIDEKDLDKRSEAVDYWITYKSDRHKLDLNIWEESNMFGSDIFLVSCKLDELDKESEMSKLFSRIKRSSKTKKISLLKEELPKIRVFFSFKGRVLELKVTSDTKGEVFIIPFTEEKGCTVF